MGPDADRDWQALSNSLSPRAEKASALVKDSQISFRLEITSRFFSEECNALLRDEYVMYVVFQ